VKPSELLRLKDWTQGHLARDVNGEVECYNSDKACSFCMLGAIYRTLGHMSTQSTAIRKYLNETYGAIGPYNDNICKSKQVAVAILEEAENAIGL
jgi:hypothetical protein